MRGAAKTIAGALLPLPSPAFVVEPGGVIGVMLAPSALATSRRPPAILGASVALSASVFASSLLRSWLAVSAGNFASTSAAAPETSGVAIEVPLIQA